MADGGSDNFNNFKNLPIRMYVSAILDGDPEIGLLYESVCDHNDSKNQDNHRSLCTPIVPEQTQAPEPSEVERMRKEIFVYEEPIEHSDERETSSHNDTDSDFEISEDSDAELQDDAVLELEFPRVNETGVKTDKAKVTTNDSDDDMSRTISDIPTGLGNVSPCPNDESVNNNENNAPVDYANSGKRVNQIKEKKRVLLTQIMKNIDRSKNKSDKPSVPNVNSGKHGGSKARRTIEVEDDDDITLISSRKRKASKIDHKKKLKEANVKKPRFHEAETSKGGADRNEPVVVLALPAKKQKVVPADEPRPVVAKPLIRGSGPSGSVVVQPGEAIKKNSVKADELRINAAKPSNCGPKKLKSKAEENGCVRKVNKDVHLSDSETGTDRSSYGFGGLLQFEPSGSLAVVRAGQPNKQKVVQAKDIGADKHKAFGSRSGLGRVDKIKEQKAAAKAKEPWVDVVKETNNGPKWHAKCKASGICSGLDKCGPSASVPVWGRANSRPVDQELMVCQVNRNPADFEIAQRLVRKNLR